MHSRAFSERSYRCFGPNRAYAFCDLCASMRSVLIPFRPARQ